MANLSIKRAPVAFAPLTRLAALALAGLVAACSAGGNSPDSSAPNSAVSSLAGEMRSAFCEGRSSDIVALLRDEPLASPADRFYLALSLEASGYALAARDIYQELAERRDAGSVDVACGGQRVVSGSIAAESLDRLTSLNVRLANFDVRPDPGLRLHKGLPPRKALAGASNSGVPVKPNPNPNIPAPASASTSGLFFAHLASYRAEENVQPGIQQLTELYAGLAGAITSWQTASTGGPIWRVGIRTIDFSDAETLCAALEANGSYCRVLDTTQ